VENQVAVIYAVTNGYLDDIEIDLMREWELGFHEALAARNQSLLDGIREGGQLTDELTEQLISAIESYNQTFAAEHEPATASA
jgi:F-type H+-transporting ATPase subunit alpha